MQNLSTLADMTVNKVNPFSNKHSKAANDIVLNKDGEFI